jgi:exopolysaccharide/PEP-CTERM locus tyrosine autokinase
MAQASQFSATWACGRERFGMNLIEQAVKRLEELQQAGVDQLSRGGEPSLGAARAGREVRSVDSLRHGAPQSADLHAPEVVAKKEPSKVELDLTVLAASGVMTPDAPRSALAEEFRVIKRPLLHNAFRRSGTAAPNANLIIVTSALPGEGKSFTAANLAMSIAMERERTVLLVDADVARPSLPKMLGLSTSAGLLDVLVDKSLDVGDVLIKTNIETFSVLSSGTPHPHATELLASDAMSRLLQEMAQRYSDRLIIFDSPPLLLTTEARVLASHMGQVVMVVQAERTAHSDVMHALSTVESVPLKFMVLNKARAGSSHNYRYQNGYYAHGA